MIQFSTVWLIQCDSYCMNHTVIRKIGKNIKKNGPEQVTRLSSNRSFIFEIEHVVIRKVFIWFCTDTVCNNAKKSMIFNYNFWIRNACLIRTSSFVDLLDWSHCVDCLFQQRISWATNKIILANNKAKIQISELRKETNERIIQVKELSSNSARHCINNVYIKIISAH